jgi:DNA-binding ferritin-like protein
MKVSVEILQKQLSNTIVLNAYVQRTEMHFRDLHKPIAELLTCMSRELCAISTLVNGRVGALGLKQGTSALHFDAVESSSEAGADEVSLEALLNRFCKYAKTTESARSLAEQAKDIDTVRLLDQIISLVNEAVWFLDVYSNALSINCALTLLPAWRPMAGSVHRVA